MTLAANWLTFLAVFILVGAAGARVLFARLEVSALGTEAWTDADALARRVGVMAAVTLVVAAAFRLLAQSGSILDPGESLGIATVRSALSTTWGRGWWCQLGAAGLAIVLSLGSPPFAVVAGILMAATLPLTGHAMEAPGGPVLGVALSAAHVFAGALWLGTLGVMLYSWHRSDPPERSGRRHIRLSRLIERFSPIALVSALVLVLSGTVEATWLVGSVRALWVTAYGQRLLLKLGLLVALLAAGAYNWQVVRPTLGSRGSSHRLLRAVALELGIAVLVLAVTASLVATPTGE